MRRARGMAVAGTSPVISSFSFRSCVCDTAPSEAKLFKSIGIGATLIMIFRSELGVDADPDVDPDVDPVVSMWSRMYVLCMYDVCTMRTRLWFRILPRVTDMGTVGAVRAG